MTKIIKMSDKVFDYQMQVEEQIFNKTSELVETLLKGKKMRNDINLKLEEIDNLLFERHQCLCASCITKTLEDKK